MNKTSVFSALNLKNTKPFKSLININTQLQYYQKNNSDDTIIKLVALESKTFGTVMEKLICELFNFSPRISPQHDAIFNNKKIEIKTARYWSNSSDCKWQHIELKYDYDYVLFALLDFTCIKMWVMTKEKLTKDMIDKKILIPQGKQGHWTNKSHILLYLIEIQTLEDMTKFIL